MIESAYTAGVAQADVAISQWQARVASGRTVGNFAERVALLLSAAKTDFNKKVVAGATQLAVRERGQRMSMLTGHILAAARRLFRQQQLIIEFAVTNDFRNALTKLVAREDLTAAEQKEQEQQALRRAIFDYKAMAAKLEDSALGLVVDDERLSDVTAALEEIMREFPESPAAKLEEVRKVERQARRQSSGSGGGGDGKRRKGLAKALGVSLSLVGMLRPPGYGNLQGFIGYATSLLGLPLDLLLGVQNDGDSPEVQWVPSIFMLSYYMPVH